jgi:two-component system cell cycle response regulator DivK
MSEQPSILYVEDDPQSRKLMMMLLKGRMQLPHVTILEDSEDFEAHIATLDPKPTIILLDIHVRPYNGFQMLEILRAQPWLNGAPIVALTASVMSEEVQQLKSAGFDGCLGKPINIDTFPDTLARIENGEVVWRIME